jgi:hypothetical protein
MNNGNIISPQRSISPVDVYEITTKKGIEDRGKRFFE